MTTPTVSIIIPTYNRARVLFRALDSVCAQTFTDWECIIVDDGSTDDTWKVHFQYYVYGRIYGIWQENSGANAARNAGIKAARGQYVAFLDSDDEWMPNFLALQVERIQKKHAALAYCWGTVIFDDYVYDRCGTYEETHDTHSLYHAVLIGNFTPTTSQIIANRLSLLDIGGFDPSLPTHQEREMLIRLAQDYNVTYTPAVLARIHHEDESFGHVSANGGAMCEASEIIYRKHWKALGREGLKTKFLVKSSLGMTFGRQDPVGGRKFARYLLTERETQLTGALCWLLSWTPAAIRARAPRFVRLFRQLRGRETLPAWMASMRSRLDEIPGQQAGR